MPHCSAPEDAPKQLELDEILLKTLEPGFEVWVPKICCIPTLESRSRVENNVKESNPQSEDLVRTGTRNAPKSDLANLQYYSSNTGKQDMKNNHSDMCPSIAHRWYKVDREIDRHLTSCCVQSVGSKLINISCGISWGIIWSERPMQGRDQCFGPACCTRFRITSVRSISTFNSPKGELKNFQCLLIQGYCKILQRATP